MKAPKNFYNAVDQSKLGIDDLFTRTAENEADIAALETVVGDDTSGLVKSVSDLETVVGDLDGGLVKDVHDLQDDSEHYHDDIEDLKAADVTINLRIDGVEDVVGNSTTGLVKAVNDIEDDIDGHLLADTTSADEGKIMSVDSTGAWALATPAGGGSDVVIVNATLYGTTQYVLDKTGQEIVSELLNGKVVVIIEKTSATYIAYYSVQYDSAGATFDSVIMRSNGNCALRRILLSNSQSSYVNFVEQSYMFVPKTIVSDNGKILSVVNGVPAWVTPT